jgi:hypothetical protein
LKAIQFPEAIAEFVIAVVVVAFPVALAKLTVKTFVPAVP